ncbi:hypothetical protein [Corynebacterium propinquum]
MSVPLRRSAPETKASATPLTPAEKLSDGALGAAGHSLDDPHLRELRRLVAVGRLTGDDAIRRGLDHLENR